MSEIPIDLAQKIAESVNTSLLKIVPELSKAIG